jgi:hypothetical protein
VLAPFAPVDNAYAVIRSPDPDPDVPLLAYASVVDNFSGDALTIQASGGGEPPPGYEVTAGCSFDWPE